MIKKMLDVGQVVHGRMVGPSRDGRYALEDGPGLWAVVEATPYEASAHNDRWTDRSYRFVQVLTDTVDLTADGDATVYRVSTHDAIEGGELMDWTFEVKRSVIYELHAAAHRPKHEAVS